MGPRQNTLTLARDRIGEKPLYYGWQRGAFLFGSELKALRAHPAWAAEIDRSALSLYMRHQVVPGPRTIFRDVYKLPPATSLTLPFGANGLKPGALPLPITTGAYTTQLRKDWQIDGRAPMRMRSLKLDDRLREAIRDQMVADVPLGALLSGGIDSSTVVALMQQHASRPVKTSASAFTKARYDEPGDAKAVGATSAPITPSSMSPPDEAQAVIPASARDLR